MTLSKMTLKGDTAKWRSWTRKVSLINLALLLSAPIAAALDRELTQEYSTCVENSHGVTVEMVDCMLAETKRQDTQLNDNYKALMLKLTSERKKILLDAERIWIQFRDANCRFYEDTNGGTSATLAAKECFLNATADRAAELKTLLAHEQNR